MSSLGEKKGFLLEPWMKIQWLCDKIKMIYHYTSFRQIIPYLCVVWAADTVVCLLNCKSILDRTPSAAQPFL